MENDIEIKVRNILQEVLGANANVEEIELEDDLADWGLNSSGVLKAFVLIENEFSFEFSDEDFDSAHFQNLHTLISCISNKLKNK